MIILVDKEVESGEIPEWRLIEFQGRFSHYESDQKEFFNEFIGDLNYSRDGIPFLLNGHEIMYGREVKLRRPLAVLRKNFENDSVEKQYLVMAVIRKKIVFLKRPKPVIPHEIPINNG